MKRIISMLSVVFLGLTGTVKESEKFNYSYTVISSSNDMSDLLYMYNVKEKTINNYESLIFNVNENFHKETIIDNLEYFSGEDYFAEYKNGDLVITIGNGKGKSISGDLRKNSCDSKPVRVQFFFSKFFS